MRPAELPRTAELVLVTADGKPVGVLPPVPVATPWWQEVEPVVQAARQHHGVEIVVRLIDTERDGPHGGARASSHVPRNCRRACTARTATPVQSVRRWNRLSRMGKGRRWVSAAL